MIKLILKTKLPSEKKDSDITKNPQLITAVITLAEQENDQDMLQSELQLIGYMLKNNFDGIKIDWENAEELLDFIPKLFAKK